MDSLVKEIWSFAEDSKSLYFLYHQRGDPDLDPTKYLKPFLFATMDEVRLRHADSYIKAVLRISDLHDTEHFRRGVLRREVTGDISYHKQRDHSAHTLYNYLFGWYVYEASPAIREQITAHFARRGWAHRHANFANIWPFVSILHDIGYLFEGSLEPLSTALQSRQVSIGANIADDYFRHRYWIESRVPSTDDRRRLLKLSGVQIPAFGDGTVAGVADALRSLGNLERLRGATAKRRDKSGAAAGTPDFLTTQDGLPGDAFDLWRRHYQYYGLDTMAKRIDLAEEVFESLMRYGFGNTGLRVLDHGICGGLLLLLHSTFYYNMLAGLGDLPPSDPNDLGAVRRFQSAIPNNVDYDPYWWWSAIVWATAATAIHNIEQQEVWTADLGRPEPLRIDEDPLAYLGILVDCLEEWDRYTVSRDSVLGGLLPLQGADVQLGSGRGKVLLDFADSGRKKKVQKSLDIALGGWNDIVELC